MRLWKERDSIVGAGNFHPEHGVFVFKFLNPCPIIAKTSISAMDVHVYRICGSEAAKDYVLQMALQSRFRKTLYACSSVIQSLSQHEPLQMSSTLVWTAVFLAVLWVRQEPLGTRAWSGKYPNCSSDSLVLLDKGRSKHHRFISSTQNQLVRFSTSFHFMKTT